MYVCSGGGLYLWVPSLFRPFNVNEHQIFLGYVLSLNEYCYKVTVFMSRFFIHELICNSQK
jgi:hypothetical protein